MQKQYLPEIIVRLQSIHPAKIILFGSQAGGDADEDSDLDLLVVTSSDKLPASHREMEDTYLEVARLLRDVRRQGTPARACGASPSLALSARMGCV